MNYMLKKILFILIINIFACHTNAKVKEIIDSKRSVSVIPREKRFSSSNLKSAGLKKAIKLNTVADKLKKYASKRQLFDVNPKYGIGDNIKHLATEKVTGKMKPSVNNLEKEIRVKVFNKKQNRTNNGILHNFNINPNNIFNDIQKGKQEVNRNKKSNGTIFPELYDPIITGNFIRSNQTPTALEDYVLWLVREKSKLDRFRQLKSEMELMNRIVYSDHQDDSANHFNNKKNNLFELRKKLNKIIEQLEKEENRKISEEL